MKTKNLVQLITYPDSLGGNLPSLLEILDQYFTDLFPGGIHILPPFPSSGDRGFAVISYGDIDPQFGDWSDIRNLAEKYDIMLDLIVNHVSSQSEYFQDFVQHGRRSKYADMFITLEKVWGDRLPSRSEIDEIFLRRSEPFSEYVIEDTGLPEKVWTTFGKTEPSEQIDIDINSEIVKQYIENVFNLFHDNGVKYVRLDAVGFVIKKPDSSCFFEEPEIIGFLDSTKEMAQKFDLKVLPEVHGHYTVHKTLVDNNFWTYDFILPYLVLEAMILRKGNSLTSYLKSRSPHQFTMLDCHDGVPIMPDLNDIVDYRDARVVVETCLERGSNLSLIHSPQHQSDDGFNVHQIRGTYYSMLNSDDDAYITARAIQLFTPGIPQIYYMGLLAAENDIRRYEEVGDGREINRHNFNLSEISEAVQKDVVQRQFKLIHFRNDHTAFSGNFSIQVITESCFDLEWKREESFCRLSVDLGNFKNTITYNHDNGEIQKYIP